MKNYKLYIIQPNYKILLTSFSTNKINHFRLAAPYDEDIQENENDQATLTFSILGQMISCSDNEYKNYNSIDITTSRKDVVVTNNYFISLMPVGARLELEIDDGEKVIDFIIKTIAPEMNNGVIVYKFTLEDEVSYSWARRNVGYSYSTVSKDEVDGDGNPILVLKTPLEIGQEILEQNNIRDWRCSSLISSESIISTGIENKITCEITNSNPYNAFIEVCNLIRAQLVVDYKNKLIGFKNKKDAKFSGYRFHPKTNLKNLTISTDSSNLATIMHVSGGTNANGEIVTILPPIPTLLQKFFADQVTGDEPVEIVFPDKADYVAEEDDEDKALKDEAYIFSSILSQEINQVINTNECPLYDSEEEQINTINGEQLYITTKSAVPVSHTILPLTSFGQYLVDFSYFKNIAKILTEDNYEKLLSLFNKDLCFWNVKMKLTSESYYNLMYNKTMVETTAKILGEEYGACISYLCEKNAPKDDISTLEEEQVSATQATFVEGQTTTKEEEIANLITKIQNTFIDGKYFDSYVKLYGSTRPVTKENTTSVYYYNELEYWEDLAEELYGKKILYYADKYKETNKKLAKLQSDLNSTPNNELNLNTITGLKAEIASLEAKASIYKSYGLGWNETEDQIEASSIYGLLKDIFISNAALYINSLTGTTDTKGLINIRNSYQEKIDEIWSYIYSRYGQYIYEVSYENTEELDSVSLFNQAVAAFEQQRVPVTTYGITSLNTEQLEQIELPNLRVGNLIRVYEDLYGLAGQELIITGLGYKLKNPEEVTINVEDFNPYKNILRKLLISTK